MSIRFQADNDLKFGIVKAARQREPSMEFVSAREAGLDSVDDPELLNRAAEEGRVLVSHDRRTMLHYFRAHLAEGKSSPGLLIVSQGSHWGSRRSLALRLGLLRSTRSSRSGPLLAIPLPSRVHSVSLECEMAES